MAGHDDGIGEMVKEKDEIRDCGVSSFDDDDESEKFENELHQIEDINDIQRRSVDEYVLEGYTYTRDENRNDLQDAETPMPSTVHEGQDQNRALTFFQSMLAASELSSEFVRSSTPPISTVSAFPPRRPTLLQPDRNILAEKDNFPPTMSGWTPRPDREAQHSAHDDNEDHRPSRPSAFDNVQEQEDFLRALENAVGPTTIEFEEKLSPAVTASKDQLDGSRGRVVQPSFTSMRGQGESSDQNESRERSSAGHTSAETTQYIQQRDCLPLPDPLTSPQNPEGMHQTQQTEPQPQPTIEESQIPVYRDTHQAGKLEPQGSAVTPQITTDVQTTMSDIDFSHDSLVRALIESAPGLDLNEPGLTNRCRGMDYIPFKTTDERDRTQNDHVLTMHDVLSRLRAAIMRRLRIVQPRSPVLDPRIATVENFLYIKAVHILRARFPEQDQCFADLENFNRPTAQLAILNRLLQYIDLTIRPNGPVHLGNSLDAWSVAAMKWQREIHEDWIAELEINKKRKGSGDDDDDDDKADCQGRDVKKPRINLSKKADKKPTRRPGRPPGSLNKSTIAARLKQAANQEKQPSQQPPSMGTTRGDVRLRQEGVEEYTPGELGPGELGPAVLRTPRTSTNGSASARIHDLPQPQLRGQGRGQLQDPQNHYQPAQIQLGRSESLPALTNSSINSTQPGPNRQFYHYQQNLPPPQMQQPHEHFQPYLQAHYPSSNLNQAHFQEPSRSPPFHPQRASPLPSPTLTQP